MSVLTGMPLMAKKTPSQKPATIAGFYGLGVWFPGFFGGSQPGEGGGDFVSQRLAIARMIPNRLLYSAKQTTIVYGLSGNGEFGDQSGLRI